MKFKIYLEPLIELFFSNLDLDHKKLRFLGRIPIFRNNGFDKKYSRNLLDYTPKDINFLTKPTSLIYQIKEEGFSSKLSISSSLLEYIRNYILITPFVNRQTGIGRYFLDLENLKKPDEGHIYSIFNPHLKDLKIKNFAVKQVKPLADAYLGTDSVILNSQIWATFPDDKSTYNPDFGFHYDIDDYRFLKLFIYLSDVDIDSGPHEIIRGSHLGNAFFRFFNRRLTEPLPKRFKNDVRVILGKAGEGFFEDTICYHRGARPKKPRLMLQIEFALNKNNKR